MDLCNIMTGSGCGSNLNWSLLWLTLVILAFLLLILKKQCEEGILSGTGFNFPAAIVGTTISALLLIILTGSARWTLLAGAIGLAIGGFLLGYFMNGGTE